MTLKKVFNKPPSTPLLPLNLEAGLPFWEGFSLKLQRLVFPEMITALIFHRSKGIIWFVLFQGNFARKITWWNDTQTLYHNHAYPSLKMCNTDNCIAVAVQNCVYLIKCIYIQQRRMRYHASSCFESTILKLEKQVSSSALLMMFRTLKSEGA